VQYHQEEVYQKYKPHQGGIFTPFLPSNQLPGPFVPMSSHYTPPKYEATLVEDTRQDPEPSQVYQHHQEQSYHQSYVTPTPIQAHKFQNHNYQSQAHYAAAPQPAATPEPVKHYFQYEKYNPETYANVKHAILQQEKPQYAAAPQPQHFEDSEEAVPQYVKYEKPLPAKPKPEYQVKQIYLRPAEAVTHRAPATQLTLHKGKYGGFKPNYSATPAPTTQHTTAEAYDDIDYYPKLAQKPIYYPVSTTATPYRPKFVMKTQLRPTTSGTRYATPKPATTKYHQHHRSQAAPPAKLTPALDYQQDFKDRSLADILKKLQDSNTLPQTLTPDNIDNSIRTLVKILNNLKQTQTIHEAPPQKHQHIDYDTGDEYYDTDDDTSGQMGPNSGKPGVDYPALAEIPKTTFSCKEQRYKGFFGDPETNCQVWHYCDLNGGQASFLCPNGTIFSQVALTCDWWFNVKCSSTAQLYVLNERLYKYILPFQPKFPEDYSGPLVDK
jgi:Chitin binding Peritrophin-A domain